MKKSTRVLFSGQKKMLWAFALSTLAAAVLVSLLLWEMLLGNALEEARSNQRRLGQALAEHFQAELDHRLQTLQLLARSESFSSLKEKKLIDPGLKGIPEDVEREKRVLMASLTGSEGLFSSLFLWLPDGDSYLVEPFATQQRLSKANFADRPYFIEASGIRAPVISDVFSSAAGNLGVVIDVPVLDAEGRILAHLGGVFHLSKLSEILHNEFIGPLGRGFLVDRTGTLIAHSDPQRLNVGTLENLAGHPLLAAEQNALTAGETGARVRIFNDPLDGSSRLGVVVPLDWGWRLVLSQGMAEINAQIRKQLFDVSGLVVLVLLATGSLGLVIVWRIGRSWVRADEELARARDELEDRVEQRTAELRQLNQELVLEIAERRKMEHRLREMAATDELTGLLNRRGFFGLVEHQLRIAQRTGKEMLLCYADLDGLKLINDTLGHNVGDQAIADAAEVLRQTFRQSDILARIGGDEFVILVTDPVARSEEGISARLQDTILNHNQNSTRRYVLSLSLGMLRCDPEKPLSIDDLLAQADRWMYRQKQARKQGDDPWSHKPQSDCQTGWLF